MTLSAAEQRLWRAYPTGAAVDLGGGSVAASVISRLLLGAREPKPGFAPAVRLRNAVVLGELDLNGGQLTGEATFRDCVFDTAPDLRNARTSELRFESCTLPGFVASGVQVTGVLSLSGSLIEGPVNLSEARLSANLRLVETRVITPLGGPFALYAAGLAVEGSMSAMRSVIVGGMNLVGARIAGGLFLQRAHLSNPGRYALDAHNLVAADAVECSNGFRAEGTVKLRNARIDGTLSFDQAVRLSSPGSVALHLSHMNVGELILSPTLEPVVPFQPGEPAIDGIVNLSYSHFTVLMDRGPRSWPSELRLAGTVYESLRGGGVSQRIDWVARDPNGFRPQPYEQLSAWYLRDGNEHLARKTQLMKFRRRRRLLPWWSRAWSTLLDVTVGYGYRPWQSAGWLAGLVVLGTVVFSLIPPRPLREPAELPDFHALAYVIDMMIPISAFGLRDTWNPVGWTQWLAYGIIASGWILATALIAGVTRVLKPN
ncbi:oxidoreductase [Actinocorallia lasiicapitis]